MPAEARGPRRGWWLGRAHPGPAWPDTSVARAGGFRGWMRHHGDWTRCDWATPREIALWRVVQLHRRTIAALVDDNEHLRRNAAEVFLEEAHLVRGKLDFRARSAAACKLFALFSELLRCEDGTPAPNFMLWRGISPEHGELLLTVQRGTGKTPEERYVEEHAAREAADARIAELELALTKEAARG